MSPVSEALALLLCCLLAAFLYFRGKSSRFRLLGDKLDGPKPLPLIGNVLDVGPIWSSRIEKFRRVQEVAQQYRETPCRLWLGPILGVLLTKAEHVEILANSAEFDKPMFYTFADVILGNGVLTLPGASWVKDRKLLNPLFNSRRLDTFMEKFCKCAQIMLESLRSKVGGPEFDIAHEIDQCTINISCESTIGVDTNNPEQRSKNEKFLHSIFQWEGCMVDRFLRPWLYPDYFYRKSSMGRKEAKAIKVVRDYFRDAVRSMESQMKDAQPDAVTETEDKKMEFTPFLTSLMQIFHNGSFVADNKILAEVATLILAGQETTAVTLTFAAHRLAIHPEIQDKVLLEQRAIFGDSNRVPTTKDLSQMLYLENVIKETLRMYPPLPLIGRTLKNDIQIDDKIVPAGTQLAIATCVLHRRDDYYPEPLKFDPDRFLPENVSKRHPYSYVPFSAGRRNCIGLVYAMMEMKVIMSMLLREFVLLPGSKTDIEKDIDFMFLIRTVPPIKIRIAQRSD